MEEFKAATNGEELLPWYKVFIATYNVIGPNKILSFIVKALLKLKGDTDAIEIINIAKL